MQQNDQKQTNMVPKIEKKFQINFNECKNSPKTTKQRYYNIIHSVHNLD